MRRVLTICTEDQSTPNIPLTQSLIYSKTVNLFNSIKVERGEEVAKKSLKLANVCSFGLRKAAIVIT